MRPGSLILTQEGMVFGTPEFMSPEQARGQTLDARSDIYSLACILYEALTGKLPFDATTPMEDVGKHVTAEPIPLNDRVPGMKFPEGLWKAIAKALAKQKDGRYQSATDFARALAPFAPAGYAAAAFVNAPPAHPATSSAPPHQAFRCAAAAKRLRQRARDAANAHHHHPYSASRSPAWSSAASPPC